MDRPRPGPRRRARRSRGVLRLAAPLAGWIALAAPTARAPAEVAASAPESPVIVATGAADPRLAPLDRLMTSFMAAHQVPGGALAVARGGRLVYARGFGWADVDAREPVEPASLFRIASVSKPLTAVAVLQLVEQGRIGLQDKVWDLLGVKPHLEPGANVDPRLRQVTVRQCLQHTGGWDAAKSFDPMFRPVEIARALGLAPPAGPADVIRYMFGRPLDFDPGARYAYSNFGYAVLGRVIERVTGEPYEAYVRAAVLAPLGITDMRIGRTLPSGRAPREVRYYDPLGRTGPAVVGGRLGEPVPLPYGAFYLEGFDAHGGWIASAVDLVRFAAAFDDPDRCRLLGPEMIRVMFACPEGPAGHEPDGSPRDAWYGCGWSVRPVGDKANHWHAGQVDGTASLLVRRHDGLAWAVLFNAHADRAGKPLVGLIDPLVHGAADAVREWPDVDLFSRYLGPAAGK